MESLQLWIELIIKYALMLFNKNQWHALLIFLICITTMTEQIKRIFFMKFTVARKRRAIYITSATIAVVGSIIGYFVNSANIPLWFWVFTACTGGMVSNLTQRVVIGFIRWKWPDLAAKMEGKNAAV